jgi:FtsH-binding integral membrane protein
MEPYVDTAITAVARAESRFVSRVFLWMGAGLVLSAATAAWVGTNDRLYEQLWLSGGALRWIVLFAPIGIILLLSFAMARLSYASVVALYGAFAFTQGLTLSFIFQAYSDAAIAQAFGAASVAFIGAGAVGYVTKRDLGRLRMVLLLGLVGLIAASLVNLLWASSALYWGVTYAGVALFTLLTAYDVWWVKRVGSEIEAGETKDKVAIFGAIALYLDFVNLLLFFLRIFGGRS